MYGTYEKLALIKKILCGLVLWKALMVYGARTTPSWSIFDSKNKNGEKKVMSVKIDNKIWRSNFLQIHFMGNSNSSVSTLFFSWRNIILKSNLILWKWNLYTYKCKQTFPEKRDSQKRDYHFRMEVVPPFENGNLWPSHLTYVTGKKNWSN